MEKYQTFTPRLIALIVDGLIFIPLGFISYPISKLNLPPVILYLWILMMTLAQPLYTILMHGLYGQTFGKMLTKVKVVSLNENLITFHHAVLRSMPQIFFSLMLLFFSQPQGNFYSTETAGVLITVFYYLWTILDIIVFFDNEKRRALHDLIAGTIVIRTN